VLRVAETFVSLTLLPVFPSSLPVPYRYVYKGLSTPENAPNFLKWHGYIVTRAGVGCIVRSMTDRKTV